MGKRRSTVVIVSSDDDNDNDDVFTIGRNCSSSNSKPTLRNSKSVLNSKSRTAYARPTAKKARLSHPLSTSAELLSNFDEVKLFLNEFVMSGFLFIQLKKIGVNFQL